MSRKLLISSRLYAFGALFNAFGSGSSVMTGARLEDVWYLLLAAGQMAIAAWLVGQAWRAEVDSFRHRLAGRFAAAIAASATIGDETARWSVTEDADGGLTVARLPNQPAPDPS